MSGVGDTSANSVAIAYDAIVTPVSEAVTNAAIASVNTTFMSLLCRTFFTTIPHQRT